MSLQQWLENAWLEKHQTTMTEIRSWVEKIDRSLLDAKAVGLSDEGRYLHAYAAALVVAIASLAAEGYRTERRDSHHFRAFQSLEFTLRLPAQQIHLLDQLRKKRNLSLYDPSGAISPSEAKEMLALSQQLRQQMQAWFQTTHPHLW
jgi:hypothetical protein